eukprot:COSAG02_NODE_3366_length_6865_cov_21.795300_4_plen_121_part_00
MLVWGEVAYLSYGWIGCTSEYERPLESNLDYGVPVNEVCRETAPGSGIFTRSWSKAEVSLDCNMFTPNITLSGQRTPLPVPSTPGYVCNTTEKKSWEKCIAQHGGPIGSFAACEKTCGKQ